MFQSYISDFVPVAKFNIGLFNSVTRVVTIAPEGTICGNVPAAACIAVPIRDSYDELVTFDFNIKRTSGSAVSALPTFGVVVIESDTPLSSATDIDISSAVGTYLAADMDFENVDTSSGWVCMRATSRVVCPAGSSNSPYKYALIAINGSGTTFFSGSWRVVREEVRVFQPTK